jgi:hypothetical protein
MRRSRHARSTGAAGAARTARTAKASQKLRSAVARVPEPRYFFNLCLALYMEGKLAEGLAACSAVESNRPTAELRAKTEKLIARIKAEAKRQGIEVDARP